MRLRAMWFPGPALVALLALAGDRAGAQDLVVHGFLQANYSVRLVDPRETDPRGDFLLGDNRLQLELAHASDSGTVSFLTKVDLFHDGTTGDADLDVREAYVTLAGNKADLRIGRQMITWGVGDLVFINDVFTKDWTALIAGRPLQYLKVGTDGANLNLYLGGLSAQVIAVPFFEPDRLPSGRRLVAFDPSPGVPRSQRRPDQTVENTELAGRIYGYVGGFDLSFYAYRGFWHSPPSVEAGRESVVSFYPELSVYGASLQGGFAGGILSAEFGLYDSRDDRDGLDPRIENSQLRLLVGYQRALGDDLTVGAQYYAERMQDRDAYLGSLPAAVPSRAATRHSVTGRVTRFFRYQTYQLSTFAWVSPNEKDFYVNPELRYTITDEAWLAVGANLFGGTDDHTFFGQFERNSNVYTTLRYTF